MSGSIFVSAVRLPLAAKIAAATGGVAIVVAAVVTLSGAGFAATNNLSYTKAGPGSGTIQLYSVAASGTLNASGPCGATCNVTPPLGSLTTAWLVATPAAGSTFMGWSGACSGIQRTCAVTLPASVTATFALTNTLSYVKAGATAGTIQLYSVAASGTLNASGPCGATCNVTPPLGSLTTAWLVATPAAGSTFMGWSGACSGIQRTCAVTLPASVTATFN